MDTLILNIVIINKSILESSVYIRRYEQVVTLGTFLTKFFVALKSLTINILLTQDNFNNMQLYNTNYDSQKKYFSR